jgi:hypothetical protein
MHQSTNGERITAALSTIVAIAILGAAVTAQQVRAPQTDRLASLESDLRFQLDLAFRADGSAHKAHFAELDVALAAWRESPHNEANNQLLAEWLQDSISRTLPGADGKLPATPDFGAEAPLFVAPAHVTAPPKPAEPAPELAQALPAAAPAPRATTPSVSAAPPLARRATTVSAAPPNPVSRPPVTPPVGSTAATTEHSITIHTAPLAGASSCEAATPVISNPALAPVPTRGTRAATQELPAVQLNLAELNARIAGYHQGLKGIEAAVVAVSEPSAEQREELVVQLEDLAAQYQFVELYYDSLTEAERRHVTAPKPMSDSVELVARYVGRRAVGDDFLAEFESTPDGMPTLAERLKAVDAAVRGAVVEGR